MRDHHRVLGHNPSAHDAMARSSDTPLADSGASYGISPSRGGSFNRRVLDLTVFLLAVRQ